MARSTIDPVLQASQHPIVFTRPAPDFFEGALLGNGGMGAVVTTRPDAIVIHFGHNNVWDIRLAEDNADKIGTFQQVFDRVRSIPADSASLNDDAWYRDYCAMAVANYRKPYPRPMPCGSLLLGYDRRKAEVIGHRIDIATGLCEVYFSCGKEQATVQMVVEPAPDRLWLRVDGAPLMFERIRLIVDPQTPEAFPRAKSRIDPTSQSLQFEQVLPAAQDGQTGQSDRAFRLAIRTSAPIHPTSDPLRIEVTQSPTPSLVACAQLDEGSATAILNKDVALPTPTHDAFALAAEATRNRWRAYWNQSGIALDDPFLERTWYWNHYFFNCAFKPGVFCPGLWGNWSYGPIGSAWHGDYHLNYNIQQPFWAVFSSNHVDKHVAYVDLIDHLLPVSQKWARDYYGLRGAYFPHSAYPIRMNTHPYPLPTWGWEICETPWAVQSLWWHYLYTMDHTFLRERAFRPLKEAVLFLVDYMKRPEASGEHWGDENYHIFPTVSPELHELTPGFHLNRDCLVDLTLTRFVFNAFLQACQILAFEQAEETLVKDVRDILDHFPDYPTAESQRGRVFVSVPGEDPETIYNTPNSVMTVFPGEHHGLHSSDADRQMLVTTYRNHRNEGGNELVFYNLVGARLGILDLERFKRQIAYCMIPNGTCIARVLEAGGRYSDTLSFDFEARMGVWVENFSLPVVINECLLQSYSGVLRLFPNWPAEKRAEFRTLRAVGGFLVSAALDHGTIEWIECVSEAGARLRLYNPWSGDVRCVRSNSVMRLSGAIIEFETTIGEVLQLFPYPETRP